MCNISKITEVPSHNCVCKKALWLLVVSAQRREMLKRNIGTLSRTDRATDVRGKKCLHSGKEMSKSWRPGWLMQKLPERRWWGSWLEKIQSPEHGIQMGPRVTVMYDISQISNALLPCGDLLFLYLSFHHRQYTSISSNQNSHHWSSDF